MMIEIKCYEVIGMCFFMLFFLTVKCRCKFESKLNFPKQVSGDFLENGYLICTFTSIINWFNISNLLDVYKNLR